MIYEYDMHVAGDKVSGDAHCDKMKKQGWEVYDFQVTGFAYFIYLYWFRRPFLPIREDLLTF